MSTDWITEGAEIMRFYDGRGTPTSYRLGTIAKVAPKSFTIDLDEYRYPIEERPAAKTARNAHGAKVRVIPRDCDEARQIIAATRLDNLRGQAVTAVDSWRIHYGSGDIDAAIDALTAYRDALKGAQR